MKIVGVIPARYGSTRLPGKPLLDICGKPMLWWVYHQAMKVEGFDGVYVATDDKRIENMCHEYGMNVVMTKEHPRHIDRIQEVSQRVEADYYVCICGDEPLITPEAIQIIFPEELHDEPIMFGLMKPIKDPVELMDTGNLKVVVNFKNEGMLISRSPIPYPQKTVMFNYKKAVGVQCFNKAALDFFVNTPMSPLEKIEDSAPLRFMENGVKVQYKFVYEESLSVDTQRDIEKVRIMMQERIERGEI